MANEFGGNLGESIAWRNGLTSVLLARIAVAAAEMYSTDWECEFARWIATVDQTRGAPGFVGFDLEEIPWGEPPEAEARKQFVVEVVVHAASREIAYRLPYYPNPLQEDLHRECLRTFALMVHHFDLARRPEPRPESWPYLFRPTDAMCVRHRVFCHELGCMVCPDA